MKLSDEERLKAHFEAQNARVEAQNTRIHDWIERTKDAQMSIREHLDGLAEVMRPSNVDMLEGFERLGWIAPREERASSMRAALCEFGFKRMPKSGWEEFCYELDLIFVALPDRTDQRNIGHAALAEQIEGEAKRLKEAEKRIIVFTHNVDFHWGVIQSKAEMRLIWEGIQSAAQTLEKVATGLRKSPQSPRWRNRAQRNFRIELATKLTTIFEKEFGIEAKPKGGSVDRPLEETNDWTMFFQACAFAIMGERISPDRQAILWEAHSRR